VAAQLPLASIRWWCAHSMGGHSFAPAVLPILLWAAPACSLYHLSLEASCTGKNAFPGGDEEATCKACQAVMEHIGLRVATVPRTNEIIGSGKKKKAANPAWEKEARAYNELLLLQEILDPSTCRKSMERYDLGFVNNSHNFIRKPDGMDTAPWPVHMELNEWARNELAIFCESLMEEHEETLHELVQGRAEDFASNAQHLCKDTLDLCKPPPPPAPTPPPKKMSKKEAAEHATKVFEAMDVDANGKVTYAELLAHGEKAKQSEDYRSPPEYKGKSAEWRAAKDRQKSSKLIKELDADGDGMLSFTEYRTMWGVGGKKAKKQRGSAKSEGNPAIDFKELINALATPKLGAALGATIVALLATKKLRDGYL